MNVPPAKVTSIDEETQSIRTWEHGEPLQALQPLEDVGMLRAIYAHRIVNSGTMDHFLKVQGLAHPIQDELGDLYHPVCARTQPYLMLCGPKDCSPPGSSVHGIFQRRILEWVAISSSRGSSRPRD